MAGRHKILVPEARKNLDLLKARVMREQGFTDDTANPTAIKYEVAKEQGIPLNEKYNGHLTSKQAGKIGGPIGGNMVKELVKMAQKNMAKK